MPEIAAVCDAGPVPTDLRQWADAFRQLKKTSFDFGVLDHAKDLRLVQADFSWTDIGSWESVRRLDAKDAHADVETHTAIVENEGSTALVLESAGAYVEAAAGRIVAVLGLDNIIVVDTPDALLIAPRDRVEEVKQIVAKLTARQDGQ
jgi:mannose-1-phosphate guanylyltransferase